MLCSFTFEFNQTELDRKNMYLPQSYHGTCRKEDMGSVLDACFSFLNREPRIRVVHFEFRMLETGRPIDYYTTMTIDHHLDALSEYMNSLDVVHWPYNGCGSHSQNVVRDGRSHEVSCEACIEVLSQNYQAFCSSHFAGPKEYERANNEENFKAFLYRSMEHENSTIPLQWAGEYTWK